MDNTLDASDRLAAVSEELDGVAQILMVMYENEGDDPSAGRYLALTRMIERQAAELEEIAEIL